MTTISAASPWEFDWLIARTGCGRTEGFRAIKAQDSHGRIIGMVGYDGWTKNAVQAHMAVDTPIAWRELVSPAFEYPFEQVGVGLILASIPADNPKSIRLAKHFGFRETYRVTDGWAEGVDLVLLEMRREECRWIQQRKKVANG